jgi:hypothetical protein
MMVELTFLCTLCSLIARSPSAWGAALGVWVFRWFVFRLMLSAGAVKFSGSKKWLDGTAMAVGVHLADPQLLATANLRLV